MTSRSRSSSSVEGELRLPRPPGVLRRFWGRHPLFADILIVLVCLGFSAIPVIVAPSLSDIDSDVTPEEWTRVWPFLATIVVIGCLSLLARRRHPYAVIAAAFVVSHAYLFAPEPLGGPLVVVATYSVAVYVGTRACLLAVGIGMTVLAVSAFTLGMTGVIGADVAWNSVVGEAISAAIGGLIGANVGSRARYVAALIEHSRRLEVERDQQARLAAAAERERIARELHDIVAHSLTVMVALAEGVAASTDVDRARPGAEAIAATGREALRDMRATLGVLREPDDAPLAPLVRDTTAETVASARAAGYETRLRVSGDVGRAGSSTQLAVSRIVQEGVTNVLRHASGATRIDVDIRHEPDAVSVSVADDGIPVAAIDDAPGYGLQGLRERVELAGGTISAGPGTPHGWVVAALIPREEPPS